MAHHYMHVLSAGPLIIVRVPLPMPPWRHVLRALTPVMRSHERRQKDISGIEGVLPVDQSQCSDADLRTLDHLERAFNGDVSCMKDFMLYDWRDGAFVLARESYSHLRE